MVGFSINCGVVLLCRRTPRRGFEVSFSIFFPANRLKDGWESAPGGGGGGYFMPRVL